MNLFDKLPEHERDLIQLYINRYAYTDADDRSPSTKAPLSHILRFWAEEKESLYKLFGEQFIIERPVSLKMSVGEIASLMDKEYSRAGSPYNVFCQELRRLTIAGETNQLRYSEEYRAVIREIAEDTNVLASNTYEGYRIDIPTPDGKVITFERGCKPVRMLGKLAQAYGMNSFEPFRIWHSQKLNNKSLNGTLCLSIHPLDFMTMSDNNCDWGSCMSWQDEGCYRSGTVECMNSPLVLVAYLKSENGDMTIPGGHWNNKKWRSLFIVHDKVITSIKGYPYRSDDLTEIVLNWLLELVPADERKDYGNIIKYDYYNPGIKPKGYGENDDPLFSLVFETSGHMYNDFGSEVHMGLFKDSIPPYSGRRWLSADEKLRIDYSGAAVCMHCGEVNDMPDDETELMCTDCSYETTCECCDCRIARDGFLVLDGRTLCYDCYHEHRIWDPIEDEFHYEYDMDKIYLVPENSDVSKFSGDYHWESLAYIYVNPDLFHVSNLAANYPRYFTRDDELRKRSRWWSSWRYVCPSDLTELGLHLFDDVVLDEKGCNTFDEYYEEANQIIIDGSED